MTGDPITDCEADLLARLQSQLPYLRSCEDVGNMQTALEMEMLVAPCIRIMGNGDTAQAPMSLGISRQVMTLKWNVFVIASSFGPTIEGRFDQPALSGAGTERGIYGMLFDVRRALRGFALSSQAPFSSKLFYTGSEPWSIGESSVVYVSHWYNNVIEAGL